MLVAYIDQVGLVVDGPRKTDAAPGLIDLSARVAGGLARVRPAEIEVIARCHFLSDGQPSSVRPGAFIEGRDGGSVALQFFIEEIRRSTCGFELVLSTYFPGAFIGDTDRSGRRDGGVRDGGQFIAGTIDFGVMLVRGKGIERAVGISKHGTQYVSPGAVVAGRRRIIPPGADGFRARDDAIVDRAVLPRGPQDARKQAFVSGCFVPNRMGLTSIELRAVVATAVAHNASAIADRVDERIHARRRSFVRSVFLADLDCAPVAPHPDIGVARAQTLLDLCVRGRSGGRRKGNLRLDLEYAGQIGGKLARAANAEIRQVARGLGQPAIVADRAKAVG